MPPMVLAKQFKTFGHNWSWLATHNLWTLCIVCVCIPKFCKRCFFHNSCLLFATLSTCCLHSSHFRQKTDSSFGWPEKANEGLCIIASTNVIPQLGFVLLLHLQMSEFFWDKDLWFFHTRIGKILDKCVFQVWNLPNFRCHKIGKKNI